MVHSEPIAILIVEDDEDDYFLTHEALVSPSSHTGRAQFRGDIVWAPSLSRALEELQERQFDVVLLDLTLPDASGLEGLSAIHEARHELPVVIHTPLDDQDKATEALAQGAQDYVVKGQFDTLTRVISFAIERQKILSELEEMTERAMALTEMKSVFLANMSHEIRTPLTAILGFTEEMACAHLAPDDYKQSVRAVFRNCKHLLQVVNDVLDLSKIEAGRLDVECIPVSPFEIVEDVEGLMKPRAQKKAIGFNIRYEWPLPQCVHTDPTRLRQILFNLVGNAIKFTSQGYVEVVVSCDPETEMLLFKVIDTGIGLSEVQQTKLFKAFSQGDVCTAREFGGTGLGLVISEALTQKLGGELRLCSEEGQGATFSFSVRTGTLSESEMCHKAEDRKKSVRQSEERQTVVNFSGRVLVADDGPDNRLLISFLLKRAGAEYHLVENGRLAVDAALSHDFDLVLMDMSMPVMNGEDAVKALREEGYTKPIIAITGKVLEDDESACRKAGCNDFLRKPFRRQEFYEVLSRYLNQKSLPSSEG